MLQHLALSPVAAFTCFVLAHSNVEGQSLTTIKSNAEFPTPRFDMFETWAGDGKIYLVGGSDGVNCLDEIHLYDAYADTLTLVGHMPIKAEGRGLTTDEQGNLVMFGGTCEGQRFPYIIKYNITSGTSDVMGLLPETIRDVIGLTSAPGNPNAVLLFGGNEVLEVDLTRFNMSRFGWIPRDSYALSYNGDGQILLFKELTEFQLYNPSDDRLVDFARPEVFISSGLGFMYIPNESRSNHIYIVGNAGPINGRGDGIVQFDFEALEFTHLRVENYPAEHNTTFNRAATAFDPVVRRLFMFGGVTQPGVGIRKEIWYIDFSDDDVPTLEVLG